MLRRQSASLPSPVSLWVVHFLTILVLSLGIYPRVLNLPASSPYSRFDKKVTESQEPLNPHYSLF